MTIVSEKSKEITIQKSANVNVKVLRRCRFCGQPLYEKLSKCDGEIQIKCSKCGKFVNMNLALRKVCH